MITSTRRAWEKKNREKLREYHKKYHQKWYQENKEKRQQQIKEYGKTHKEDSVRRTQKYTAKNKEKVYSYGRGYNKTIAGNYRIYKSNARKKNNEFTLSLEEFTEIVVFPCTYCGESENRIGIDRIDNEKGYTKENSTSCCKVCNYMKRKMSVKEFLQHIDKIYKYNNKLL